MIPLILAALMTITPVEHSFRESNDGTSGNTRRIAFVWVSTCYGDVKPIYADKELTIPLPNPLVVDLSMGYTYWTTNSLEEVVIEQADFEKIVIRTCRTEAP